MGLFEQRETIEAGIAFDDVVVQFSLARGVFFVQIFGDLVLGADRFRQHMKRQARRNALIVKAQPEHRKIFLRKREEVELYVVDSLLM